MDGFGAAFAVFCRFPNAPIEYVAADLRYSREDKEFWLKTVSKKKVLIVDFSFEREQLLELNNAASELCLLDHHKSAKEKLEDLDFCHFKDEISGALMTWHAFFNGRPPKLFKYLSDRDLWSFKLPYSQHINEYVKATPKTFDSWKVLLETLENDLEGTAKVGVTLLNQTNNQAEFIANKAEMWSIKGVDVMAVNSPILISEVCHLILSSPKCKGIAGSYYIKGDRMCWSFRSDKNHDCSKLAELLKGGGHKDAAGGHIELKDNRISLATKCIL
jgi:oligoribonuclease NrnB/cAMP/cGMP phosphodiesterase (DHH superfamily)